MKIKNMVYLMAIQAVIKENQKGEMDNMGKKSGGSTSVNRELYPGMKTRNEDFGFLKCKIKEPKT